MTLHRGESLSGLPLLEQTLLDKNSVLGRTQPIQFIGPGTINPPVRAGEARLIDVSFPWPLTVTVTLVGQIPWPVLDPFRFAFPIFRINQGAQGADDIQEIGLGIRPMPELSTVENAALIRREITLTCQSLQVDVRVATGGDPLPAGTPDVMTFKAYVSPASVQTVNQRVSPVQADFVRTSLIPISTLGVQFPADSRRIQAVVQPSPNTTATAANNRIRDLVTNDIISEFGGVSTVIGYQWHSPIGYTAGFVVDNVSGATSARVTEYLSSRIGEGF